MESIVATASGIILTALFTGLLWRKRISQPSYIILLTLTAIVCLVLHGFPRVRQLDLKKLTMTLDEIKQVKADIYAKQDDYQKTTQLLTELVIFQNAMSQMIFNADIARYQRHWVNSKVSEILQSLKSPSVNTQMLFQYQSVFDQILQPETWGSSPPDVYSNLFKMIEKEYGSPE